MSIDIRPALLDDTATISALARSHVSAWQRFDERGDVETVRYEALSVYERWLHGGPWMSVETGALQLSHLRRYERLPLGAWDGGELVGYAEAYPGVEPAPFGRNLHLGVLYVRPGSGANDALMRWLVQKAGADGYERVTANCAANDAGMAAFYQRHGLTRLVDVVRLELPTRAGQVFYRAVERANADNIHGWHLSVGRLGSAAHQWDMHWERTWDAVPEIAAHPTHRIHFSAAGNEAYVLVRQQRYRPRVADVFCWTPKPLSGQLVSAIRDWAQREDYRRLVLPTLGESVSVLGADAEPDGYREHIYAVDL